MLVYGDHQQIADARQRAREINRQLDAIAAMAPGLERHAELISALIETGKLLQGVADAAVDKSKADRASPAADELRQHLLELGRAVCRSWDSSLRDIGELPRLQVRPDWPGEVELRLPEGYAFYALYPEAYIDAARRLRLLAAPRVIGIRSIGTSLAAVAAAALDAPPPVTIRPFGDPFARQVAIDAELERELLDADAHYVLVDEGPGQSGSSFGAVADWLQERGVPLERIALIPSHGGAPGAAASEERCSWWTNVQREVGGFGDRWPDLIERWFGPLDQPPEDISGGAWRKLHYDREEDWPASIPAWERRKFLVHRRGERFLVKFSGLGRIGEEKFAIGQALYGEGLVPEPLGSVHGFIVERWCEGAAPLSSGEKPLQEIAWYIDTRAKLLPAMSGSGASVAELVRMARRNIALELGEQVASALEPRQRDARDLERRVVRVRTDNKLDRQEWLRTASGALIKTDALDHHAGHDLIGCQDVAWDVAGAIAEFDFDQEESRELVRLIEESGVSVDPDLLAFYRIAYLAFRLGQCRMGASMSERSEQRRINARADGYAAQLQHLLEPTRAATRPDSLVG